MSTKLPSLPVATVTDEAREGTTLRGLPQPEQDDPGAAVRTQFVTHLESLVAGSDRWSGRRETNGRKPED